MSYPSLRDFLAHLEQRGELKRVPFTVDPRFEMTVLCQRSLRASGPALWFERPQGHDMPVLGNLFGTTARIAAALGYDDVRQLRELGEVLSFLREPQWPDRPAMLLEKLPAFLPLLKATPRVTSGLDCVDRVLSGPEVDLTRLPVWTCWPEDAGPLITWGLVITCGTRKPRQNVALYRQQVIGRNRVIMRWLTHRAGALDFRDWQKTHPDKPFPVVVALGADPALLIAATAPIPDSVSEFQFAGLLRRRRSEVFRTRVGLDAPATAEIVLEGHIAPGDTALEGPFGDHTGYYNDQAHFPVLTVERMTLRRDAFYHGGYMGRSPLDEPSMLAMSLNEMFVPMLQRSFPEIADFYLPPEACSYRLAVVSIRKAYAGHGRQIMQAVWSYLRQFLYIKFVIVTDEDIDVRNWQEVIWAMTTRVDPARDSHLVRRTPIDYLDFASPIAGLGSKLGIDATNKWPAETRRRWGRPLAMSPEVTQRGNALWQQLQMETSPRR
ncbi:UbiD family decarboxylase [Peristeroidobacter agariperforans]|uniref:UbiD family decarboxylase n=1 Tax=Peristeroidobacter agariperforans TaxID=268404 RepID=UPI00101B90C2|nr:UbiD family decarboxylase [Peristeroidobacter agariperforans]